MKNLIICIFFTGERGVGAIILLDKYSEEYYICII